MGKFKKWAGVILRNDDEVLLCKRSPEKSLPNVWSIPSGKIEDGESTFYQASYEIGTLLKNMYVDPIVEDKEKKKDVTV